jgi:DNA-binding transcriptional LysR family regulator
MAAAVTPAPRSLRLHPLASSFCCAAVPSTIMGWSIKTTGLLVTPAICDFMARYPQVEVELKVSDRPVDLIEGGVDLAIRIGELPGSGLKARRLGELRLVVFAAPSYLAAHGRPGHPDDLASHECLLRLGNGGTELWPFRIAGRRKTVRVNGRFRTDAPLPPMSP